jgi:hypothetical protein
VHITSTLSFLGGVNTDPALLAVFPLMSWSLQHTTITSVGAAGPTRGRCRRYVPIAVDDASARGVSSYGGDPWARGRPMRVFLHAVGLSSATCAGRARLSRAKWCRKQARQIGQPLLRPHGRKRG